MDFIAQDEPVVAYLRRPVGGSLLVMVVQAAKHNAQALLCDVIADVGQSLVYGTSTG